MTGNQLGQLAMAPDGYERLLAFHAGSVVIAAHDLAQARAQAQGHTAPRGHAVYEAALEILSRVVHGDLPPLMTECVDTCRGMGLRLR